MTKLLIKHVLFITAVAAVCLYAGGVGSAVAGLYGGLSALVYELIQRRYMLRSVQAAGLDAGQSIRLLLRCATERILAVVVLLTLGLGALKLDAGPLVLAFVATVAAQVIDRLTTRI